MRNEDIIHYTSFIIHLLLHHPSNISHLTDECRGGFHQRGIRFSESEDKQVWGFSQKQIKQAEQTKPNPTPHKVDKWTGDWRSL